MYHLKNCVWDLIKATNKCFIFFKCGNNNVDENSISIIRDDNSYTVNYMNYHFYLIDNNDLIIDIKKLFKIKNYETNYVFTYVILIYNGTIYNINLKSCDYTYYIIGNNLDVMFFKKYLEKYYGIKITSDIFSIEVVDHKLKKINIEPDKVILLQKDNYEII